LRIIAQTKLLVNYESLEGCISNEGDGIDYIAHEHGDSLPESYKREWSPFVTSLNSRAIAYRDKLPIAILLYITNDTIQGFLDYRTQLGEKLKTVQLRKSSVSLLLRKAHEAGLIEEHPYFNRTPSPKVSPLNPRRKKGSPLSKPKLLKFVQSVPTNVLRPGFEAPIFSYTPLMF
jgi:hypothetical protein